MARLPQTLVAEERATYIRGAIAHWRKMSAEQGKKLSSSSDFPLWNETHRYWAIFGETRANTKLGWRYWNAFGTEPKAFRSNMLVEINPPQSGVAKGTQGLIALDAQGGRWVLHGGRIHPGKTRVDTEAFASLSGLTPVEVSFSSGFKQPYFLVAPLDRGADALHAGLAHFIQRCGYVRDVVLYGKEEADLEHGIADAEGASNPEKRGSYVIPPRGEVVAKRIHADVWRALAAQLDRRKINHTTAKAARYAPDLRTRADPLVLFEIKTDTTARSIYEALGQLLMYERLIGKSYAKVLVVPGDPPEKLAGVLKDFQIAIIVYRERGRSYSFNHAPLDQLFRGEGRKAASS